MINQKGSATVIFIFGILILSGLIIGGSFFIKKNVLPKSQSVQTLPTSNNNPSQQPESFQPSKIETIVSPEEKVVKNFIQAVENSDWQTIYKMTSSTFTSNSTIDTFVSNMQAQEKEIGKVESAEILSKPEINTSPQGIKTFRIQTKVVYNKNGIKTTQTFFDNFVWENNQWRFWFSESSK